MSTTVTQGLRSVVEVVRYRGRFGQLDWVLHRVSGLGVLLFLMVHILDTATVYFAPAIYDVFLGIYKSVPFGLLEIGLAASLIYHALNGLRIAIMDFWPQLWDRQPQARRLVWVGFAVLFIPTAALQFFYIVRHVFGY